MKKFIILYNGPATPQDQMTEEQGKKVMALWGAWMEKNAQAIVDIGQPMAPGVAIVDDGSAGTATLMNGYSIIQAEDMDGAKTVVSDHPFLSDKTGKFSVEIFELLPMPM